MNLNVALPLIACTLPLVNAASLRKPSVVARSATLASDGVKKGVHEAPNDSTGFAVNHSICNTSLPGFDNDRCFEHVLGRTRKQLRAELAADDMAQFDPAKALNFTASFANGSHFEKAEKCPRPFYLWTFMEFETAFPTLATCHVTTYAAIVQAQAMKHPCRTANPAEAHVMMIPPYTALECNWPAYGGGDCFKAANTFRHGILCTHQVMHVVAQVETANPGKQVLLVDQTPSFNVYELPQVEYGKAGRIWAKVNSLPPWYRQGSDISMPPAATDRCRMTPAEAWEEPLSAKRFFASFKGQLRTTIRFVARRLHNNDKDIVIVPSEDFRFDFDELLRKSVFNLILGGDVEFSYRFNEAVCSGGVPVLVTDKWVPPFNEFLPFDSYGVLMKEGDIGNMIAILKALPWAEVERRRVNARKFCVNDFQTTEATVSALLRHLGGGA